MQYVQDFDETFPVGIKLSGDPRYRLGWPATVYPYVKSKAVYLCPSDQIPSYGSGDLLSYNYNLNIPNPSEISGEIASLRSPARTVILCEMSNAPYRYVLVTDPFNIGASLGKGTQNFGNMAYATGYFGAFGKNAGGLDSDGSIFKVRRDVI